MTIVKENDGMFSLAEIDNFFPGALSLFFNHNPVNPLWIRAATKQSHIHWYGRASVQQVEGIRVNSLHKKGRIVS